MPCPANYNPADFYIFSLATVRGEEDESKQRNTAICDAFEQSQMGQELVEVVKAQRSLHSSTDNSAYIEKRARSPYKASWWTQFRTVLWRSWLTVLRDPAFITIKASTSIVGYTKSTNQILHFIHFYLIILFYFLNDEDCCRFDSTDLPESDYRCSERPKHSRCPLHFPDHRQLQQRLWSRQRIFSFFLETFFF